MSESIAAKGPGRSFGAILARLGEAKEAALPSRVQRIAREGGAFPLSSGQQRLWFIEQLQPGNPAYNISAAVSFSGPLDVTALERSLAGIVRRHETLRTTFHEGPQGPVQVVAPAGGGETFPLPVLDLSSLAEPAGEVAALARREAALPFDLVRGPLLRVTLLRLGVQEHVLLFTLHHVVGGGWLVVVWWGGAVPFGGVFWAALPAELPELPVQYVDYAAWQHGWLQSPAAGRQREHWLQRLKGVSGVLQLPSDRPRPSVRTPWGGKHFLAVPALLRDALLALGRDEKVTPFVLFLAAWDTLLYRLSGQNDVLVGTAVANRNRVEVRDLIGFFVNTLVLRAGLRGGMSFRELLRTLGQEALAAFENQELPFDQLVAELQPERQLSHTPLFQASFAFQNVPMPAWDLAGLRLAPLWIDSGTSAFDLTLDLKDQPERIAGWLEYSADLFDAATVARFAGHLEVLLRGVVEDPSRPLAELPLLTAPERQQILEWNSVAVGPASDLLHRRIEAQAARTPEAVAVVSGGESLTYRELNARANRLAHHLRRLGVGPGSLAGLCLHRSPDLLAGLMGIVKTGATYLPVDPAYPPERWGFMLQDAGLQVLLTQEALLPLLPEPAWEVLCLDRDRALWADCPEEDPPPAGGLEDLLYVIYTSGSTGRPKGAGVYQSSFAILLDWYKDELGMDADDRFLLVNSISFDATQKNLFVPFLAGGQLHLPPPGPYDPAVLVEAIGREGITRVNCTPSAFYPLVEREEHFPRLASLRSVTLGGEPISLSRLERWRRSPHCRAEIINTYGPTEATDTMAFHRLPPPGVRSTVPVGRPTPGTRLLVLGTGLDPVPLGVAGHLCLSGVCVGVGYLRDARATAEKFLPDPFASEPGARLYLTGDLARWLPGGEIDFLGRIDHQVKVRGFRIEPGEIEAVLESHAGVSEAVVMARESAGDGGVRLVAWLRADPEWTSPGRLLTDLRGFVRERLPASMVPSAWVLLDSFPLTPSGKVDRKALPDPGSAPEEEDERDFVPPRDLTEDTLARIWAEVLGLPRVGATDNFFDLGGHSLLGTRVVSRVREALGVELPVRALFEAPTVEALAARVTGLQREQEGALLPPLVAGPRPERLPLSFAQQRLWFLLQLEPEGVAYHVPAAVRLEGALEPAVLAAALGGVVARHEALRTTFEPWDGGAVQVVAPPSPGPAGLPLADLAGLPRAAREGEALRLARAEVARPFDVRRGPLLRSSLLRLGDGEHVLLLVMHHIVSDGWSMGVLVRETVALYRAASRREPAALPALPVQYPDFALWQRSWLQGEALERQIRFWRRHLAGAPAVLELPADRPRTGPSRRGGRVPVRLKPEVLERLGTLTRRESATLFMALLAGFCSLLERYTGQDDLVVGTPIANRTRPEIEPLIGFFINTLALRTQLAEGETSRELLRRVRAAALEAYAHQDLPFERLVEELSPERHLDHTPLFQVMLTLQNAPGGETAIPGLRVTPVDLANSESKLDWALTLWEGEGGGLEGTFAFKTALWDEATARRIADHWQRLLAGLAEAPDDRLSGLPMLSPAELRQLEEWNDSRRMREETGSVHGAFERQAARVPEAPAVVFEDRTLRYGELNARANAVARRLIGLGVGPEEAVGICLERSAEVIVALLGVLKSGGAYLPLDPALPRERIRQMLADARVRVVLAGDALRGLLPGEGLEVLPVEETGTGDGLGDPDPETAPEQLAYVLFTSGSTGTPRGVGVEHRQLLNYVSGILERLDLSEVESFATVSTLAADLGNTSLFPALLTGRCLHVISEERLSHPEGMAEYFDRHRVDVLKIVPSHLLALETPERPAGPLPRRTLVMGGEASFRDHAERIRAAAPGLAVLNHYGPTETTVGVLTHRFGSAPEGPALPLGRPLANSRMFVVDALGRLTPVGVPGELWIGGAGVSRGYLNRPDRTAERFVPDPFSGLPGERLYRTGDRVRRRPDGALEFLGRIDHQVKIRGFRIELGEIEAALELHPGVRESVVVARGGRAGEKRLAAYVVAEGGEAGELRRALRERLPDYMVPGDFVFLDRLPLTPNGKVDRRALPAPDEASAPAAGEAAAGEAGAASWAEELLAGFWTEVLGVERVGPNGDFFALGGHSLLATQLMSRVRRAFGVEIPLRTLFEAPTPALLAHRIAEAARSARPAPPLRPVPRDGELPLSFAQQRLWFIHQLDPGSASYNVPRAVRLAGALCPEALEAALGEVVRRHEVLRTTFPVVDGRPSLEIAPPRPLVLPRVDLSGLPDGLRETEGRRLAGEEARRPFDLGRGPLLRHVLVRGGSEEHTLLLTLHHVVSDGWSTGVLVREMGTLYRAFAEGRPSPLPEPPVQYADFAHWQRQWLTGEVLEEQLAYWRRQLAGLPDGLDLPLDRPRPALPSLEGDLRVRAFPAELRAAIDRLGREQGATFFMVMLAVFATLLSRLTRQTDVVAGSPIANRNRVEIEGLIGFFVNTLVLRVDTSGPPTFAALLEQVREVALGAGTHQDLPFERLVEELAPERNLGRTPLFQVVIAVQNAPAEALALPGLSWEELPGDGDTRTSNFDLTLRLFEAAGGLQASLEYKTALFDATTIDRLLGHLATLAGAAVADPQAPVSRLPILGEPERDQIAREPLARVRDFPAGVPLHRLFERQAARTPGAVAVTGDGGDGGRLTYAGLDARAGRLAARLRRLGVGPEVRVALWLDRTVELVVGILGVLKAGGAYVPIDPSYPEDRLRFLLEDAGAPVLVSVGGLRGRLDVEGVATVLLDEDDGEPLAPLAPVPDLPESTAYVIYTSGSTGRPKGVPVSHANVVRLFTATEEWFGFGATDVWTLFHSYAFDFSVWELWGALLYGGRLVVVPYWVSRSPEAFRALLAEEGVTVLNQTPSAFHQLAAVDGEPGARGDLALRRVVFGGEALEPRRLRPWFDRHGDRRPTLVNMYGITETTVHVTFRPLSADDLERGSVIGVPIPDLWIHVLDPEGEPVPFGVPGEIHVGGAGLARGYLGRPELTAQRFVPDPFGSRPGARLYASGDLARRRPDGELEYLGRADQQVKIRGFRIEPGEIEAALAQHPAVREVVVLAHGDQGEKRLVAYLGIGDGAAPGVDELRSFLKERLPEHMIPAVFVPLPALPLTPHGKVDRRALPGPEAARPDLEAGYVAPRTPEEAALAEVWAEVLEVDRVGVHDNFFALGGDSIRSIRVLSLAGERGLRFSLPQLFQHQTIAELVPHRRTGPDEDAGEPSGPFSLLTESERAALPEGVEDAYPLSALQLGMLFHSEFSEEVTAYHNVFTVRLSRTVDTEALRAAAAKLAGRHPVLRTSFALAGLGRPLQLVHQRVEVPVTEEDLRALAPEEREAAVSRRFEEEKARRFAWGRPPLLRFHLQHLDGGETQLFWAEHHAILDGWSVAVLLAELFQLDRIAREGGALLPAPATPYREFIALELAVLESAEARSFWRDLLRGAEPPFLLPEHPENEDRDRDPLNVPLPASVVAGLRDLAAAADVPLKSVFLAAHVWVVGRITGTADVVTGLVTNGRPETADAERMLGLFLNTVPLRAPLSGGTWIDLARRMFELEREILPFRRYPIADIQRELGPLFDTAFNYVNFYIMGEAEQASGARLDRVRASAYTNFALAVELNQDSARGTVALRVQRDPAVLSQPRLRSIAALFERVLAAMAFTPEGRHEEAGFLSPAERRQVLLPVERRSLRAAEPAPRTGGEPSAAPRDELERELAGFWEELLGVSPVGVADDFFALGGNSLLIVLLAVRIEQALGVRLSMSTFLEAPTVELLAARLRHGSTARRSPLVALQLRGSGRPLFLVHPIGGDVTCYVELARHLGADRPLYGLQAVPDGEPASLESLAARYLEEVREVQKEGPYLVGGWSLGGAIAYEMARQLEAGGERVALLAMVDPGPPQRNGSEEPGDAALLLRVAEDLVRLSGREAPFGPEVLEGLDAEAGLARLLELGKSEGILPPDVEISHLRERFEVFRRHLRAVGSYAPGAFGGPVAFFRATGSMTPDVADPTCGWGTLARVDLDILDGDHYSLLRAPRVEVLAEALRRRLEAASQQAE